MGKKTLIIGASENPERYSYKAAERLLAHGHDIYMLGNRAGTLFEHEITTDKVAYDDVDSVTMYVGVKHQPDYYDYIISLKPRRVIFNPGTENPEFFEMLDKAGIQHEQACTLVLLATDGF